MTLSQAQQKTLESYLADGETAITACSRESVTYLLTDRRLFTYHEKNNGTTTAKSQFLDGLGGVNIRKKEGRDLNTDSLAAGLIALFTGLVSLALQGQMSEGIAALFIVIGVAGLFGGIIALIHAFDTEEGQISVQLRTQEGEIAKSLQLHETSLEFAEAISKAASNAHKPDEEHVKKVSA